MKANGGLPRGWHMLPPLPPAAPLPANAGRWWLGGADLPPTRVIVGFVRSVRGACAALQPPLRRIIQLSGVLRLDSGQALLL